MTLMCTSGASFVWMQPNKHAANIVNPIICFMLVNLNIVLNCFLCKKFYCYCCRWFASYFEPEQKKKIVQVLDREVSNKFASVQIMLIKLVVCETSQVKNIRYHITAPFCRLTD